MDSNPVIFDISSDEEPMFDERSGCDDDDHNWLTQLIETFDKGATHSDDVVVVGEYNPPKPKSKSNSSLKPVKDFEDDDCVVLDDNPDKRVDVVDEPDSDGDEVLVVGQKGQIACRDYPHPRHLCVKFPFGSTPHQRHCDLCHCYVCDSLAPCVHWGTGVSSIDHCHATDKVEIWKSQRENFRLGKNAALPVSACPNACLPVAVPQAHHVATLDVQLPPNLVTQDQVSRPTTIRPCPSARMTIPSITGQYRTRQTGCAQSRNGVLPRPVSRQLSNISNNAVLRNRGTQFVSNNTTFKRPGIIRLRNASAMNQSVYLNNINRPPASNYVRNTVPLATVNAKSHSAGWQDVVPNMIPDSYAYTSPSQPDMGCINIDTVSSQPEVLNELIPQSNDARNIYQLGNQSQNIMDSSFPEFDFWINNLNQSNQQTPAESVPLPGTGSNRKPTIMKQLSSQLGESTEVQHKDNEYDSWLFSEYEACVPPDTNAFSAEPSMLDVGMLYFDFEPSMQV
ncbi:hypothetical protein JCGZ_17608 [Jatropha curcas]|uniref:RPM1 interacting protein 13 n=1 Tax=Jatropha curcas TaxID=180498 RepID=A0A067K2F3_JATCU|nr:uncharacterized protein LOC105644460 [Jatropha curcas]KDP26450.1 hypothetical protein JCGZ_17608 [Jatropha curcas]